MKEIECNNCQSINVNAKYCNVCGFELLITESNTKNNASLTIEDSKRNKITKHHFKLPDFPDANFALEVSIWTGRLKLFMNSEQLEQSKEKGKPFLIPKANNEFLKAFPKQTFPDLIPGLEINGVKNNIAEKLKWFQYVLGGIPILLLFFGGAIGGVIGVIATMMNYNIFRQEGTSTIKCLKVIAIIIISLIVYFVIMTLLKRFMF
ncbi:hypothetical protein [uncultured Flavobacterium sp.]|uniref:hypothetical protein n=1 Tax=uncultured Flavobacterium sp. TaxID=165435 RepID=UPI0030819ECD